MDEVSDALAKHILPTLTVVLNPKVKHSIGLASSPVVEKNKIK